MDHQVELTVAEPGAGVAARSGRYGRAASRKEYLKGVSSKNEVINLSNKPSWSHYGYTNTSFEALEIPAKPSDGGLRYLLYVVSKGLTTAWISVSCEINAPIFSGPTHLPTKMPPVCPQRCIGD